MHAAMPFTKKLDVQAVVVGPAEVRARLAWSEGVCTSGGMMHGGAIMTLADSTAALCAFLNLPDGASGTSTIESKTNFLRAVRSGYAEAVSRPLHTGRSVVVIETDVVDADGKLCARVTQTQAVLRAS
ncbi:MAG TPA: PaaI family thioesterase [Actinomycetota bacterium]|nr:PaaI family thioesterase [Actinomycetota bacterium]